MIISIKDQLQQTLNYEQVILQFYRELAERLADTDMGQTCREAAASAEARVNKIDAWLQCAT